MASVRSTSVGTTAGAAPSPTVTITKPSGLIVGDIQIAYIVGHTSLGSFPANISTPTGWTALPSDSVTASSTTASFYPFYKVADATDVAASSFSFVSTQSSGNTSLTGILVAVKDPDPITPYNTSAEVTVATGSVSGAAITPTYNSLLLMFGGFDGIVTFTSPTITNHNPTWTIDVNTTQSTISVMLAHGAYPFTTTTGAASFGSGSAKQNLYLIALNATAPVTPSALSLALSLNKPVVPVTIASTLTLASAIATPTVSAIAALWTNVTKNVSTWLNPPKI